MPHPTGRCPLSSHVQPVFNFRPPSDVKGLQHILGMLIFFHCFLHSIACVLQPLTKACKALAPSPGLSSCRLHSILPNPPLPLLFLCSIPIQLPFYSWLQVPQTPMFEVSCSIMPGAPGVRWSFSPTNSPPQSPAMPLLIENSLPHTFLQYSPFLFLPRWSSFYPLH